MMYLEKSVKIQAQDCELLGIVSLPAENIVSKQSAVLIVTGGAQYRIGSHRQFVRMARKLASAGYPAMRFDMPGMGDSTGKALSFEENALYIAASIEVLVRNSGAHKVYLWGLCDGASAILIYLNATKVKRIAGLILLNPWIRSETSIARVYINYYYPRRIIKADFWRKLLSGNIGSKAVKELLDSFRKIVKKTATVENVIQDQMAKGWASFEGPILLLLSECDLIAQEFREYTKENKLWKEVIKKKPPQQFILKDADHTCSQTEFHNSMASNTLAWLQSRDLKFMKE